MTRFEFIRLFLGWPGGPGPNPWPPELGLPKSPGPNCGACPPGTSSSLLELRGVVLCSSAILLNFMYLNSALYCVQSSQRGSPFGFFQNLTCNSPQGLGAYRPLRGRNVSY